MISIDRPQRESRPYEFLLQKTKDFQDSEMILHDTERLLLTHEKTMRFFISSGEEFNPGPEMGLDHSELLCNKVLLKYKGDRESF